MGAQQWIPQFSIIIAYFVLHIGQGSLSLAKELLWRHAQILAKKLPICFLKELQNRQT